MTRSSTAGTLDVFTATLEDLTHSSSDIRGCFVAASPRDNDDDADSWESVAAAIRAVPTNGIPPLTLLAAYAEELFDNSMIVPEESHPIQIGIGMAPRWHGMVLADVLSRGAESFSEGVVQVSFNTAICTTLAMASFCRMQKCRAAMVRRIFIYFFPCGLLFLDGDRTYSSVLLY